MSRQWEQSGIDVIRNYFQTVWQILVRPSLFFRKMPTEGGIFTPLAFALVTHWLGSAIGFFWKFSIGLSFSDLFKPFFYNSKSYSLEVDQLGRTAQLIELREKIFDWLFGMGHVVTDPFFTLFSIFFTAGLIFLGARIFISSKHLRAHFQDEVTFEAVLRIVCYGMTPTALVALPLIGSPIASFYSVVVTTIGAKEVYKLGWFRSAVFALFPKILFLGIILSGLFFFAFFIIRLLASFIS